MTRKPTRIHSHCESRRRRGRGLTLFCLGAVGLFWQRPGEAQERLPLDAQGLVVPAGDGTFAAVRPPWRQDDISLKARLGYILEPLELRVATLEPDPRTDPALEHVALLELFGTIPLPAQFDFGVGWGAHLYQTGSGLGTVSGGTDGLPSFALRDPRAELGWTTSTLPVSLRPFVALTFPLGNEATFASETATRVEVGLSAGQRTQAQGRLSWAFEADVIFRKPLQHEALTWGTQARFSAALRVRLTPWFSVGPEIFIAPLLGTQPGSSGPLIPAEALVLARVRKSHWALSIGGGGGIPLSKSSLQSGLERGPTSPLLRFFAELCILLEAPRALRGKPQAPIAAPAPETLRESSPDDQPSTTARSGARRP